MTGNQAERVERESEKERLHWTHGQNQQMVFLDIADSLINTDIFSEMANSLIGICLFLDGVYFLRYFWLYIFRSNNTKIHHNSLFCKKGK